MARQIFIVNAYIVDSTGAFHFIDGYPKTFDSKTYGDDVAKTQRRAEGDFSEQWGVMCKRDDRMVQTVTLSTAYGYQLDIRTTGIFVENAPEPEEEE